MAEYVKDWKAEEFLAKITGDVMRKAEIVGKFVESDAKRRLLAVSEPEWGERYRRAFVARLIMYTVGQDAEGVVITVGVMRTGERMAEDEDKAERRDKGEERTGSPEGYHGLYIELGSRNAPAHPFLRPAVFENAAEIMGLLCGG